MRSEATPPARWGLACGSTPATQLDLWFLTASSPISLAGTTEFLYEPPRPRRYGFREAPKRAAPILLQSWWQNFACFQRVEEFRSRRETKPEVDAGMAPNLDPSRGENLGSNANDGVISERVQELTWSLVDEQVDADEFRLLENLLLSDDKARDTYIGCVQLHVDLMAQFAAPPREAGAKVSTGSQILGFLNADVSGFGFESPSTEETGQ